MSRATSKNIPRKRFSLIQKLVASYAAMTLFIMAAMIFSILGLYSLNRTAREIAKRDLAVVDTVNKLRESIIAQERYASKYAILKSGEFVDLYRKRERDFLETLRSFPEAASHQEVMALTSFYQAFRSDVARLLAGSSSAENQFRDSATKVLNTLDAIAGNEQIRLNEKLKAADRKEGATVRWTLILSFTGFLLSILVATLSIFNISSAIAKLKKATHRIAEGEFDYDPQIPPGDEIGDLSLDFTRMAKRLKDLEQVNLDASPLTRLPGNIAIERVLSKRLHDGVPFAVCYGDLDNFKAYNDRYGYVKASEVIKITAELIFDVVKRFGDKEAFVGHVGGDDFIIILSCEAMEAVCKEIIAAFDTEIRKHYSDEDVARGAIEGTDRYGVERIFPLMTISIAVVVSLEGEFGSAVDIARTASQLKDYAKGQPGSNYFINRRKQPR
ncbi:GGDEF domain-containing protein [Geobacter argillaceus]|uniref:diguanylate cyclase n=1 Tax=Geobacter argillaceus TaxID=345631 RepID=A0A562VH00_9BACT|nr:diguanylate cyclase [Geobacter argillaceus]TWJ17057.1 diguanylate cyclase (GGDEF)-like protein [Geobacter argillaceus]